MEDETVNLSGTRSRGEFIKLMAIFSFIHSHSTEVSTTNKTLRSSDAAHSLALGAFEQPKDTGKSPVRKIMRRLSTKSHAERQPTIKIPLHEYAARGWDATNEQWRNVIWPRLDKSFTYAAAASPPAWTLKLHPMDVDRKTELGINDMDGRAESSDDSELGMPKAPIP